MTRAALRKSLKVEAIIDNAPYEAQRGFHAGLRHRRMTLSYTVGEAAHQT